MFKRFGYNGVQLGLMFGGIDERTPVKFRSNSHVEHALEDLLRLFIFSFAKSKIIVNAS